MTNKQRQNYLTLHKKKKLTSSRIFPVRLWCLSSVYFIRWFCSNSVYRGLSVRASQTTQEVQLIHFINVNAIWTWKKVVRDDIMKVIRKFSFHLFRDLSPLTLPFLLSRRFPFAFTFLRYLLWVWRLKYITKTTQAWDNIIQNMQSSLISN